MVLMKALFIGRFQPVHKGHINVIEYGSTQYTDIIIGIGSSQYDHTLDNPFTAAEREQMLEHALAAHRVTNFQTVYIPDIHDPPRWVAHVCSLVPEFDVVLSNNEFTTRLFTNQGYTVHRTPIYKRDLYAGEEIRRRMIAGESWKFLVPTPVYEIIQNLKGAQRLQALAKS